MMINQNSLIGSLINQSALVRDQLAQVQQQVATGYVSTDYSGLGNQVLTAVSLSPQIAHQKTWSSNIDSASARLTVSQGALTSIQGVASDFFARVDAVDPKDANSIQNMIVAARSALSAVASTINTKAGDAYVFSGTDTQTAPVTTTDPTTLATDLLASDVPGSPPFSATIGTSAPQVETGDGLWTSVGLVASQNTYSVPAAPTTGSSMRDVMRALASLTTLTPANASTVLTDVRGRLSGAIDALSTEAGGLAATQNTLKQRQTELSAFGNALQAQLSSVQDVDVAAAITKSSTLQTQLQASYQIIAKSEQLSLANFI